MEHQGIVHQIIGPQRARILSATAPIWHHRAAPIKAEHGGNRLALVTNRQDIGLVPKRIEHGIEQALRKYWSPQIADAFGIDCIVRRAVGRICANRNRKFKPQRSAHFCALFAGDGEQFCLIIRRQITRESEICFAVMMPASAGHNPAT